MASDPERLAAIRDWFTRYGYDGGLGSLPYKDIEYLLALAERVPHLEQQLKDEKAQFDTLFDLPLCRLQLPDGSVPSCTEEALAAWHRVAEDALRQVNVLKPGGMYAWKCKAEAAEARVKDLEQQLAEKERLVETQRHRIDRFASGTLLGKHGMEQADRTGQLEQDLKDRQQQLAVQVQTHKKLQSYHEDTLASYLEICQAIVPDAERADDKDWPSETFAAIVVKLKQDLKDCQQQLALTEQERNLRLNTDESVKLRHIAEVILPDVQRQLVDRTADLERLEQQVMVSKPGDTYVWKHRAEAAEADREQALKDLSAERAAHRICTEGQQVILDKLNAHVTAHQEAASKLAACDALPRYQDEDGEWIKRADLDHVLHPKP